MPKLTEKPKALDIQLRFWVVLSTFGFFVYPIFLILIILYGGVILNRPGIKPRLLAFMLALIMTLGYLPTPVMALHGGFGYVSIDVSDDNEDSSTEAKTEDPNTPDYEYTSTEEPEEENSEAPDEDLPDIGTPDTPEYEEQEPSEPQEPEDSQYPQYPPNIPEEPELPSSGAGINVDLSGLSALIEKAEGLHYAEYTTDSWELLYAALDAARYIYADPRASQAQADEAKYKLRVAIDALELAIVPASGEMITVFMTFEGYTLGHGFYIEPTPVTVPAGATLSEATYSLLRERGHTFSGTPGASFFLDHISGFNRGFMNPPEFIPIELEDDTDEGGTLGSFMFSPFSGWMFTLNHWLADVGGDDITLSKDDVIRWQFSVYGLGEDLGVKTWNTPSSLYTHADKTELIRAVSRSQVSAQVRQYVLDVLINPLATEEDIVSALSAIASDSLEEEGERPSVPPQDFLFEISGQGINNNSFMEQINQILISEFGQSPESLDYSVVERIRVNGTLSNAIFNWPNVSLSLSQFVRELDFSGLTGGTQPLIGNSSATQEHWWRYVEHVTLPGGINTNLIGQFANMRSLETVTWAGSVSIIGNNTNFFLGTPNLRALIFLGETAPTFTGTPNAWGFHNRSITAYVLDSTRGGFETNAFRSRFLGGVVSLGSNEASDLTYLLKALDEAEKLQENDWAPPYWAQFYTVLNRARAIAERVTTPQADVNIAVRDLESAIDNLVPYGYNSTFISVPAGTRVGAFRKGLQHFQQFQSFPVQLDENLSTQERYLFRAFIPLTGGLHIEAYIPGQTSKVAHRLNNVGEHGTTIYINPTPISSWVPQNHPWQDSNILTNLDDTGALNLNTGQIFTLDTFRVWQALESPILNYFIEPAYNFEVFGDSARVERVGAPGRERFQITGVQPGVSLIKITASPVEYIAVNGNRLLFDGVSGDNALAVVVNVDGGGSINTGINVRNDFDTFYFDNSVGHGYFNFTPAAGSGVRVHSPINVSPWGSGWQNPSQNPDNSFTARLHEGRNILEIRNGSNTQYHVIRGRGVSVDITNLTRPSEYFRPGDVASIRIRGISEPVEKLAGIYNPGFGSALAAHIVYQNGNIRLQSGSAAQWRTLETTFSVTYTIPSADRNVLTGRVYTGWMGSPVGAHRNIPPNGIGSNLNAQAVGPMSFSYLPVITLPMYEPQQAPSLPDWEAAMYRSLQYITSRVTTPDFGSVGGEWAILALARAGYPVAQGYFDAYLGRIGARLEGLAEHQDPNHTAAGWVLNPNTGRREVRLATHQTTENARLIVALTALGIDASNFVYNGHSYDLVARFGNRHAAAANNMWGTNQGINGPIWSQIAIDSRGWGNPYIIPDRAWVGGTTAANPVTTNERIEWILGARNASNGWALSGNAADPDITSMALQALAPHRTRADAGSAIEKALAVLRENQLDNGGWASLGIDNVQSAAQVVVALSTLGIDPAGPEWTTPSGGNPITAILAFQDEQTGGFIHGPGVNLMATEQASYALVAYWRFVTERNALYNMGDAFIPALVRSISLSEGGLHTFPAAVEGYATQTPLNVTISNTGDTPTGILNIRLSGANAAGFSLSQAYVASIAHNSSASFSLTPNTGLGTGTHTATVTVSGEYVEQQAFSVSFTVSPAPHVPPSAASISLTPSTNHTFPTVVVGYAQQAAHNVSITNTGTMPTGTLGISLSGASATSFTLEPASVASLAQGASSSFSVRPNTNLAIGTHTATVTVSGEGLEAHGFNVSFTVNPANLGFTPNRNALNSAIQDAQRLHAANFTAPSWAALETALSTAIQVLDHTSATQAEIDTAYTNLRAAINELISTARARISVTDPFATGSQTRIFLAEQEFELEPGETVYSLLRRTGLSIQSTGHSVWSGMYVQSINGWGEFSDGPLSGWMYRVNGIFPDFSSSLYYLRDGDVVEWLFTRDLGNDIGSGFGISRVALNAAILEAQARVQTNYTPASWSALQEAITAAQQTYDDTMATQAQINTAITGLRAALDALVHTDSAVNRDALNSEIARAEGLSPSGFSHSSWAAMQAALTAARQVQNDETATQAQIDTATNNLRTAINALSASVVIIVTPIISPYYGTAVAEIEPYVISGLIEQAVYEDADNIVIIVEVPEGIYRIEVELAAESIRELSYSGLSLTIQSDIATISLDADTLAGLVSGIEDDASVLIIAEHLKEPTSLNETQQNAVGDNFVINLKIMVAGSEIRNFSGSISVLIPYSPRVPEDFRDMLTVYHVDENGNFSEVEGAGYGNSQITFTTNSFSLFFVSEWINPFADVLRDAWYIRGVRFAYSSDIMGGTAPGVFSPNANLSRSMLITALWRMEGSPTPSNPSGFGDVQYGSWYYNAVAWASENSIIQGIGGGMFAPSENASREQLTTLLQNYAQFKGFDSEINHLEESPLVDFTDKDIISPWALDAMQWASYNDLIRGRTLNTIAPSGSLTRAETASILQAFSELTT